MKWWGFFAFCVGLVLIVELTALLTGYGILIGETHSLAKMNCRYLTLGGVVTKDFRYGDFGGERWNCAVFTDPGMPY